MCQRWYLVQIDLESTATLNPHWRTTGRYYCVFLARHPADKDKSDEFFEMVARLVSIHSLQNNKQHHLQR